jgi:hypothetical protein
VAEAKEDRVWGMPRIEGGGGSPAIGFTAKGRVPYSVDTPLSRMAVGHGRFHHGGCSGLNCRAMQLLSGGLGFSTPPIDHSDVQPVRHGPPT